MTMNPDDPHREPSARVSTRTGDDGYTGLLGPGRVAKYSLRPTAFGTLDEASSALGLARATCANRSIRETIHELQQGLYRAMAELATAPESYERAPFKMTEEDVRRLDVMSEELKAQVHIGREFVVPGGTLCGASLDLARTVVRRGERVTARLTHEGEVKNTHLLAWINRLSDVIFILARYVEATSRDKEGDGSRS